MQTSFQSIYISILSSSLNQGRLATVKYIMPHQLLYLIYQVVSATLLKYIKNICVINIKKWWQELMPLFNVNLLSFKVCCYRQYFEKMKKVPIMLNHFKYFINPIIPEKNMSFCCETLFFTKRMLSLYINNKPYEDSLKTIKFTYS